MRSSAASPYAARLEASTRGFDARYIVTSLEGEPRHLYEDIYCARGQTTSSGHGASQELVDGRAAEFQHARHALLRGRQGTPAFRPAPISA